MSVQTDLGQRHDTYTHDSSLQTLKTFCDKYLKHRGPSAELTARKDAVGVSMSAK